MDYFGVGLISVGPGRQRDYEQCVAVTFDRAQRPRTVTVGRASRLAGTGAANPVPLQTALNRAIPT